METGKTEPGHRRNRRTKTGDTKTEKSKLVSSKLVLISPVWALVGFVVVQTVKSHF